MEKPTGTALHLNHKLPWNKLHYYFKSYKYPGIRLSVGECKQIHNTASNVKKIKKHNLSVESVDCDCPCYYVTFIRKNQKKTDQLFNRRQMLDVNDQKDFNFFMSKFKQTVFEFIETLDKDFEDLQAIEEYKLKYKNDGHYREECQYITMLIETNNIGILNKIPNEKLSKYINVAHTQACGRCFECLFNNIFNTYILTNIMVICNDPDPDNWYDMSWRRRSHLLYDCDAQMFPVSFKSYILEENYIKDLDKTRELCKKLFKFICIFTYLQLKLEEGLFLDSIWPVPYIF